VFFVLRAQLGARTMCYNAHVFECHECIHSWCYWAAEKLQADICGAGWGLVRLHLG
jgi:hypothetical protein